MSGATLFTSVSQAMDSMKALGEQSLFFDSVYHQESRQVLADILRGRMKARVNAHLEACKERGIEDRRIGSYSRGLLMGVGDLRLRVPPLGAHPKKNYRPND